MTTILAHLQLREGMSPEFEKIAREMVMQTVGNEPDCLRYEYWRGAKPDRYYVLLSFRSSTAFYEHQASEWHESNASALQNCWETISLEFLDPVQGASPLPPTRAELVPASALDAVKAHAQNLPFERQTWWNNLD